MHTVAYAQECIGWCISSLYSRLVSRGVVCNMQLNKHLEICDNSRGVEEDSQQEKYNILLASHVTCLVASNQRIKSIKDNFLCMFHNLCKNKCVIPTQSSSVRNNRQTSLFSFKDSSRESLPDVTSL